MLNIDSKMSLLNSKQQEAFDLVSRGKNIFITGAAGTGKTTVIKKFLQRYKTQKTIAVTSTTGISALLIGGVTLHSYLGIGLGKGSLSSLCQKILKKSHIKQRWIDLDILIIDEISMLSVELFDKLEAVARYIRRTRLPWGGIQLFLSGDFLQLPCVNSDKFCFEAKSWSKSIDQTIILEDIIRQGDADFQNVLNECRIGRLSEQTIDILKSCKYRSNDVGIIPTRICSLNSNVDKLNSRELNKIASMGEEFFEYDMEVKQLIPNTVISKFKKNTIMPETLELAKGVQVMLLINLDVGAGLANGSRGIVVGFFEERLPIVKFLNGEQRIIDFHTVVYEENDVKTIEATQIPLKVAYALSVHKSQGCSLDYAEIDLGNIFEYGQAYVALSRVKNLNGLKIKQLDVKRIQANPKALEFYGY